MAARNLSFKDAVRLFGPDDPDLKGLDRALGGLILASAVPTGGTSLSLLGAKNEVMKSSGALLGKARAKWAGTTVVERHERVLAAHSIIIVTSFFEALELIVGSSQEELGLIPEDQVRLFAEESATAEANVAVATLLIETRIPVPGPRQGFREVQNAVTDHYRNAARRTLHLIRQLAYWDALDSTQRAILSEQLDSRLVDVAVQRYADSYRALAADAPEFGLWAMFREHEATQAQVERHMERVEALDAATGFSRMQGLLSQLTSRPAPVDALSTALDRHNSALLDKPLLLEEEALLTEGIQVPNVRQGYLPPHFKVAVADEGARPAEELWWQGIPSRNNLEAYFASLLTSETARESPILVLGHPGAGKSLLTRVLVAQLPAESFLPIRVPLREVPADADVQTQAEVAIYLATGQRAGLVEVLAANSHRLAVLVLDGFDELVRTSGLSNSDYLEKVRALQRRESDLGRALAVIVTSRTVVANGARIPAGSIMLKLEPFSERQVETWISLWNVANQGYFRQKDLASFAPALALAHMDLAEQPLLLLMLAIFDAVDNSLQAQAASEVLPTSKTKQPADDVADLYEALLNKFVAREIAKGGTDMRSRDVVAATENELARLAVTAFAMFNRNALFVDEESLKGDLGVLMDETSEPGPTERRTLESRPSIAEKVVGSFFFIYRSEADTGVRQAPERTYEFVHATFGEYLMARELKAAIVDLAPSILASGRTRRTSFDDSWLFALLAWQPLATRANVSEYFLAAPGGSSDGDDVSSALEILLLQAQMEVPRLRFTSYRPARRDAAGQLAHYTFNLLTLRLAHSDELRIDLSAIGSDWWRDLFGLWRARIAPDVMQWLAANLDVNVTDTELVVRTGRPANALPTSSPAISAQLAYAINSGDDVLHRMAELAQLFEDRQALSVLGASAGTRGPSGATLLAGLLLPEPAGRWNHSRSRVLDERFRDALAASAALSVANSASTAAAGYADALVTAMREHEFELSGDRLLKGVELLLRGAPTGPAPDLFVSILQLGIAAGWRGPAFRRSMTPHMASAAARLDPLHLLDSDPGLLLRLHVLLKPHGRLLPLLLPEAADLEFLLDRTDIEELGRTAPATAALALRLAVHNDLEDWLVTRVVRIQPEVLPLLDPTVMLALVQILEHSLAADEFHQMIDHWAKAWVGPDGLPGHAFLDGVSDVLEALRDFADDFDASSDGWEFA